MIESMDTQIGRVLEAFDANGLTENTTVIFTSDNGGERFSDAWPFTGKISDLLEGGLRIPMVIAWPARIAPGRTSDQVAISMGWLATLLAAAGAAPAISRRPSRLSGSVQCNLSADTIDWGDTGRSGPDVVRSPRSSRTSRLTSLPDPVSPFNRRPRQTNSNTHRDGTTCQHQVVGQFECNNVPGIP